MTAMRRRFAGVSDGVIGIAAAAFTVLLLVAVETGAVSGLLSPPGNRTVKARFADARQLKPGDPVRITGVNVGTVQSLSLHGRAAVVTMKLQSSAGPVYADAGAQIRFRTLLGGNFYVDLNRGRASSGTLGSQTIGQSHTGSQVELDDITSVVQGQAKQGLQKLPRQLAIALGDPRYPARSLCAASSRIATSTP
jgi:ABC-type transporter Mla subunit MlaD